MSTNPRSRSASKASYGAFMLALFSCVLGLCFCLVKSPQAKSDAYVAMAVQAIDSGNHDAAASAALKGANLNPANAKAWEILSNLLQKNGQAVAARQAANIARKLQGNMAQMEPVYAMPAELKLSLLALETSMSP